MRDVHGEGGVKRSKSFPRGPYKILAFGEVLTQNTKQGAIRLARSTVRAFPRFAGDRVSVHGANGDRIYQCQLSMADRKRVVVR